MKKGQTLVNVDKKFSFWLAAAAVMHFFAFFFALYFQLWDASRHVKPKIVSVTLLPLPGSGGSHQFSAKESDAEALPPAPLSPPLPPAAVQKRVQPPIPVKPPSAAPKIVADQSQPPKPVDKQAEFNKVLERLRHSVDAKTPPPEPPAPSVGTLGKALSRLQQKVKSEEESTGGGRSGGQATSSGGRSNMGKGYGSGGASDPYKAEIASIIQRNWEFSGSLIKNSEGMEVYVSINVLADGTIGRIVYDRRAPSEYLNNSVKKALEKSSPLPVPPKDGVARELWIGFFFTPAGIGK